MTRMIYTAQTDGCQLELVVSERPNIAAHLDGRPRVNARTFVVDGKVRGSLTIGPVKVFCDARLAEMLEPVLEAYDAERRAIEAASAEPVGETA